MDCYEAIDLIEDVIGGRLAAEMRPGFEQHMEECAACRNYLDQLQVTVHALERLPRTAEIHRGRAELLEEFRRRFGLRRL